MSEAAAPRGSSLDRAQRAEHGPPARRPGLPVARARPRVGRLGAAAAGRLRRHRLPRRLPRPAARPVHPARADPRPCGRPALHPGRGGGAGDARHHPVVGGRGPAPARPPAVGARAASCAPAATARSPCTSSARRRPSTSSTPSRCCCSATARATVATLAKVFGWAFALWGIGLYWWAGVLYAWQVRKLLTDIDRRTAAPVPDTGARAGAADRHRCAPTRRRASRRCSTRITRTRSTGLRSSRRQARAAARSAAPGHERPRAGSRDVGGGAGRAGALRPARRQALQQTRRRREATNRAQLIDQVGQRRDALAALQDAHRQTSRPGSRLRGGGRPRRAAGRPPTPPRAARSADAPASRAVSGPGRADHRRRLARAATGGGRARHRPGRRWSTGCGRRAPRRSRSTASG